MLTLKLAVKVEVEARAMNVSAIAMFVKADVVVGRGTASEKNTHPSSASLNKIMTRREVHRQRQRHISSAEHEFSAIDQDNSEET